MLDFGTPPRQIAGATVFADHAESHVYYVTVSRPTLVRRDDVPILQLALFRGDQNGGLLSFETQLAPTEEQLEAVRSELITHRELVLLEPPWRNGTVQLAGWLQTDALAPLRIELTPPSLLGKPRAIAAARLDQNAAAMARAALEQAMLPTVVIFQLETLALAGPLAVTADADLQALHDRLTAKGALQAPMSRAEIRATWEEALRDNVIRVEVLDQSLDLDGTRAEAMRRLGEELIAKMFSPYPPPERPQMLDDQSIATIELSFRLTKRREELETTSHWSFVERQAVPLRHYAAANLIGLLPPDTAAQHIRTVDLIDTRREVLIRVEPELARLGLAAVEVDLRWSEQTHADRSFVLTDAQPEASQTLDVDWNVPLHYRVRTRYDPTATSAPDQQSDWYTTTGGFVRISAGRLFPPRTLTLIIGRGELDWLDHVEVLVTLADGRKRSVVLGNTQRSADLFLPGVGDTPLDLTVHWRGSAQEPSKTEQINAVTQDLLVLDSPFGHSISVFVIPRLLHDVLSLVLEIDYADGDLRQHRSLSWTPDATAPQTVHLRRYADGPRDYRYRTVTIRNDGTLEEGDWVDSETTLLIPGADEPLKAHRVTTTLLGGGITARGAFAADVVLSAGDHLTRQVLQGAQTTADLALLVPEDSPDPTVLVREYLDNGTTREFRFDNPGQLVVVPVPAAATDPPVG